MAKKGKKKKADAGFEPYRIWLAGIGALARASEGEPELFEDLVEQGRGALTERGKKVKKKIQRVSEDVREWFGSTREDVGTRLSQAVADAVHSVGVPTADVIEDLTSKVEELTERLAGIEQVEEPAQDAAQQTEVQVLFDDSEWLVQVDGDTVGQHPTKAPAVAAAKKLAVQRSPSTLVIHKMDGAVQSRKEL